METGDYLIGTNPDKGKTGKENAVRIIKVKSITKAEEEHEEDTEETLYYALSSNSLRIYKVNEEDFQKVSPSDERIVDFKKKIEEGQRCKSYLGYDFGEVIPTNVNGYKEMVGDFIDADDEDELESGHLLFLGTEPDTDDAEAEHLVCLCWVLKDTNEKKDGTAMDESSISKTDFVKRMLVPMEEESKRITIHYINKDGIKTKQAVNDATEIKDMKEELYRMNN